MQTSKNSGRMERIFRFCCCRTRVYGVAMKMTVRLWIGIMAFAACSSLFTASAAEEKTAFALIKEGNRHVGEDAKDKVVQIRSEKSLGTLTPNIWYIVYYDPDAAAKATQVKFGGGAKLEVKREFRLFELASKAHLPLEREKLKIDSDRAIEIATAEPMLKNLKVLATRLTLERWEEMPIWKVRLWAAKLRNPNRDADIGEVFVSAETGKVIRNELKINRVD